MESANANQFLSASINESYSKQFGRGGALIPYYHSGGGGNRPRSLSAGSQQSAGMGASTGGSKKVPTTSGGSSIKVVRVGSASRAYTKTKSIDDTSTKGSNMTRYKTEMCRPYLDYGYCKYGDKCQFAHGEHELRAVPRHPKYKTELCRTYHTRGFCPYGTRCHFIHALEEVRKCSETNNSVPRSPTKKSLNFTVPISPSLDSGISSPDDLLSYGRRFEFPPTGLYLEQSSESSAAGSDDGENDFEHGTFFDATYAGDDHAFREQGELPGHDLGSSPDTFMEFDALSSGSRSPTKPLTDRDRLGSVPADLTGLFARINLDDNPSPQSPKSGKRLPVFDDMLNSKSDTALLHQQSFESSATKPFTLFH